MDIYTYYLEKCQKKKKSHILIYKSRNKPNFITKVKIKMKIGRRKNKIKTNILILFF